MNTQNDSGRLAGPRNGTQRGAVSEALAGNTVLRNTYLLLSATLIFSALMAGLAVMLNVGRINPLLMFVGMIGLLFWVQAARNSAMGLVAVFAFTGFIGFMTGPVVSGFASAFPNGSSLVMTALGGTGAIFLALSAYAIISGRDFSRMGSFLVIGAVVLMVASIANIFLHIAGLQLAVSAAAMVVFSGFMLYDTGRILDGGETNYISATVGLYLNIYNVFMSLLSLLGFANSRD